MTIPQLDGRQLKLCTKGKVCFAAQQLQRNSPCSACITRCNSSAQGRIVSGRDSTCHSVPVPCHPCGRTRSDGQHRRGWADSIVAASACRLTRPSAHSPTCTAPHRRTALALRRTAGQDVKSGDVRRISGEGESPPSARTENAQPSLM